MIDVNMGNVVNPHTQKRHKKQIAQKDLLKSIASQLSALVFAVGSVGMGYAMDKTDENLQDSPFSVVQNSSRLVALHVLNKDIWSEIDSYLFGHKLNLALTCKNFYSKYDCSLTLPISFAKVNGDFNISLDRMLSPTNLNLYYVGDQELKDLGLAGNTQEDNEATIMGLFEAPMGKLKTISLNSCSIVDETTLKLLDQKGIKVEKLPFDPVSNEFFKDRHLGDRHLHALLSLYTETHRMEGCRFQIRDYVSAYPWSYYPIPRELNQLTNMLDTYDKINKTGRVDCLDSKHPLRAMLTEFSKTPDKLYMLEQICTSHIYPSSGLFPTMGIKDKIEKMSLLNPSCIKPIQNFIPTYESFVPPYDENNYSYGWPCDVGVRDPENEFIINVEGKKRNGMNRGCIFMDFVDNLTTFSEDKQSLLLRRLLGFLSVEDIKKIVNKKKTTWAFPRQLKLALDVVESTLCDLSDEEYGVFVSILKSKETNFNILEDDSMEKLKNFKI